MRNASFPSVHKAGNEGAGPSATSAIGDHHSTVDTEAMADFKTHMTVSTATGVAYAFAGSQADVPLTTCILAGGLCSVSGMLPDLDSDSGRPLREATALCSAVVPMLMVERFQQLGLDNETMVLLAALVYLLIRFVVAEIFRRYTVHRGMWHSLPAAATVGLLAFLVMSGLDINIRIYKTCAVVLGFLSHLILDEIWSIDFRGGRFRFKSSFGTALKLWGSRNWANFATYAKLAVVCFLVYQDQQFMDRFNIDGANVHHTARQVFDSIIERGQQWIR